MKGMLYPRLALTGIKKNFKLYLPYLFACAGMMSVFYITAYLANSEFVYSQPGGTMISAVLRVGWIVLAVFSAILLFYTSSFLIKRRKTEFGLYNILGMGKTNISVILILENVFILIISLFVGISLGILFSKLMEILLINMVGGKNSLDFYVDWSVVAQEIVIYAMLFASIMLKGVHQVSNSTAIKLLQSSGSGEKPPKANPFLAVLGAVLLIAGYVTANIVKNVYYAILVFFGAVILVIVATYLLFISGSVAVCKLLKKNKKYYYKTNHFVSTSQMSFRMRRNGAGLASICILATMALVTISTTSGLYFGSEQVMRRQFPRDVTYHLVTDKEEIAEEFEKTIYETALEYNETPQNFVKYRYLYSGTSQYRDNKKMVTDIDTKGMTVDERNEFYGAFPNICFYLVPISDYNAVMGTNLSVNRGEALILKLESEPKDETYDLIAVRGESYIEKTVGETGEIIELERFKNEYLKGVGTVDDFVVTDGNELNELVFTDVWNNHFTRYRYAFINDEDFETQYQRKLESEITYYMVDSESFGSLEDIEEFKGELDPDEKVYIAHEPVLNYYFGMDYDCGYDVMEKTASDVFPNSGEFIVEKCVDEADGKLYKEVTRIGGDSICYSAREFNALYSGLFFLGVLFCIVFVLSAVMIMYYKQVTEGYEDRAKFEVLQKVGMTKSEIKSSVNSQVLTLFFLPLIAAAVHVVFAFPLLTRLLMLFGAMDVGFLILVAVICFAAYAAIYILAYILTSKSYYRIVA